MSTILKNLKYVEIDEYNTLSMVRIDKVDMFLKVITQFQPPFIYIKKRNFLKYLFNMSEQSRAVLLGKPHPMFSMESFGYEFREKVKTDKDFGTGGPKVIKLKDGVWRLKLPPEIDSEGRLMKPGCDYKIIDNGKELEVYLYLGKVKGRYIEKLTEFIVIYDGVAYILPEYDSLSDKIDPSSEKFGLYKEDDLSTFQPHYYDLLNVSQKSYDIGDGKKGSWACINQDKTMYHFDIGFDNKIDPGNPRADVFNPNNPAFKAARDNRSNQLNPNNPAYHKSRY